MGRSKTQAFSSGQNRLAALAKALGHPARIAILEYLGRNDACMCGSIVDALPLSQATVSQHLAVLKEAGLIHGDIGGPRICYCIDRTVYEEARALFADFLATPPRCCGTDHGPTTDTQQQCRRQQ